MTKTIEPDDLYAERDGGEVVLIAGGCGPVRSHAGPFEIRHEAPDLIHHIANEFREHAVITLGEDNEVIEPLTLSGYTLYGVQKAFVENNSDNLTEDFTAEISFDPVFTRLAGPEHIKQLGRYGSLLDWFASNDVSLVDLDFVDLDHRPAPIEHDERFAADFDRLRTFLWRSFRDLDAARRTAVVFLHNNHHGSLAHAIALVTGACSSADYAAGVAAAHGIFTAFPDVDAEAQADAYGGLVRDAATVLNYIVAHETGTLGGRLSALLQAGGESGEVEFKSTLRFNLYESRTDRRMTDVVTKTIAGFLNTRGGTLLVGVDDDGQVLGLAADAFESHDKFLRHLHTAVLNALGPGPASSINAEVVESSMGNVCIVECPPSPEPVLCSHKGKEPTLYIRTGPQTVPVTGEDRASYEQSRWR